MLWWRGRHNGTTGVAKRIQDLQPKVLSYSLSWTLTQLLIISEGVIHLKPLALVDNTLLDLRSSSYHTQPRPIIANFTVLSSSEIVGFLAYCVVAENIHTPSWREFHLGPPPHLPGFSVCVRNWSPPPHPSRISTK